MVSGGGKLQNADRQMSEAFITSVFLAMSGGFQDAYTYFTRDEVFSNAQTGNVVLMSHNFMTGQWGDGLRYLFPVLAFAIGVVAAERIQSTFKYAKKLHWRQMILLIEILILFVVGFMPGELDMLATVLVSFSCAMQVQTFRKVGGYSYASTMCIGNMRSGMFPDAITERGRKHLLHLKELQNEGYHTGVLFLVQWDQAQWFLPDYHTDLKFARTFKEVAPFLDWKAVAVAWDETFTMPTVTRACTYPSYVLDSEAHDSGVYIMVMHLDHELDLEIGSKGMMHFNAGYYMYVGSAKANLTKRIERHKRKRKKMHWHLDYFRGHCKMIAGVPIRTSGLPLESWSLTHEPYPSMPSMPDPNDVDVSVECALADAVRAISEWDVPKFGCSDCDCTSHLFGMTENPIHNKAFMDVVEEFRMNQLDSIIVEN